MPIDLFKKRIFRISGYIVGTIAVLLLAFHFWFVNHAESLLEELVASRSNGKLKLHVKKFRFNWFSDNMQLRNAVFYSTDTATASSAYRLTVSRVNIRIKKLWPLIFEKKILIDSLGLVNPDIRVTRLKTKDTDTASTGDRSMSLPLEMGRVYNSIQDALEVLQVNRFQMDNGSFNLKIRPDARPVTITNIYLHLDNLQVDTNNIAGKRKILFSDNVALRTYNQDISFPDGRHHISFSNFHINIFNKVVEFDSCTIAARHGDSANSSFKIFFDKLLLKNIDFDTLYQKEVIKADSVFCINPQFRLDVALEKRTGKRKPPPRLDELIQLLTGDMRLGFVSVTNGSFDINTTREGRPSSFTSDHNNFEMTGLSIDKEAPRHLTVQSFAMAIRNYENFLRDSTYATVFDSVLFVNNSVFLSNFSVRQMQNENVINRFTMPQFELKGLSWDDLVFEGKLAAEKATLHRPVIDYTVRPNKKQKQDVFEVLARIGDLIDLNNLDIDNGQINIHFPLGGQLQLENTNLSVLSEKLVQSNRVVDLQHSVRHLTFRKGLLKLKDLEMKIDGGDFSGDSGRLSAQGIVVGNRQKSLKIDAKDVRVNQFIIGDNNKYLLDGIQWQQANVEVTATGTKKKAFANFSLRNIKGGNTNVTFASGKQRFNSIFDTLAATEFSPQPNAMPVLAGLYGVGRSLSFIDGSQHLTVERFVLADHDKSEVRHLIFKNFTSADSTSITLADVEFVPDINAIMHGKIVSDDVKITKPEINITSGRSIANGKEKKFPEFAISKLTIEQPQVNILQPEDRHFTKLRWRGGEFNNNSIQIVDFRVSDKSVVSAEKIQFSLNHFSFAANGKKFNTGTGEIKTTIEKFYLEPGDVADVNWNARISDLHASSFSFDSIGQKHGQLSIETANLSGLTLNSASFTNLRQLVRENKAFEIKEITGYYKDRDNSFTWANASYDRQSRSFSVDSFIFQPLLDKDSFAASRPFQADYITLRTGLIQVAGFDPDRYLADSVMDARSVAIRGAEMTVYRDKRVPFHAGIVKPLPTILGKRIPLKFSIDTVRLENGNIEYSEFNDNTRQTGKVPFRRLNAVLFPVGNYTTGMRDSLSIIAEAWLMDSINIKLRIRESYSDTLAGFVMRASIPPTDTKILNPMLLPLASLQLHSGFLDTVSLVAVANDKVAMGEMKMFYRHLKIEFVNTRKEKNKKFLSFLANIFVRSNNRSTTGTIFWERARDKSFLNYLVKILASGASSSTGLKNNKKLLRKYKKAERKRNLPAKGND